MTTTGLSELHSTPRASATTSTHPHVVHLYEADFSLVDQTAQLLSNSLLAGDAVVVVATDKHRQAFARELESLVEMSEALKQGRYLSLDAAETLSQILVEGFPHPVRFKGLIGGVISKAIQASRTGEPCVTVFGEMVALLWAEGNYQAAIRLEQLWNDLRDQLPFSLQCSYPMRGFEKHEHTELFMRICAEHSAVIPVGPGGVLANEDERLRTIASLQQKLHVLEHEKALRESEQRFRLLVEAVQDYAIFMLDPQGRVSSWNIGAERIKGYKASEIIGEHFSRFYPAEDVESGKPARELEIATRDGRVEDEGWRIRKDGSKFWANVIITALRNESGNLVGFAKVTRDFTERVRVQQALEESQRKLAISEKSLRNLSLHLLRTQDEERRQIGRDLHDSLGQYLSVLKMKLDSLRTAAVRTHSDNAEGLQQCSELMNEAVKEVRTISYLLYPPMLEEMGLKTAIPWYLEGFGQRSGIQTKFEISLGFGRLSREVELALFRVLQESLTNVHRHSGSAEAAVRLKTGDREFVLEVSDTGKGIPFQKFEEAGRDWMGSLGVGLRGMTERMQQIGGRLEISSNEKGTIVRAIVPRSSPTNSESD
jgi:PAS domain S-box-containing protein